MCRGAMDLAGSNINALRSRSWALTAAGAGLRRVYPGNFGQKWQSVCLGSSSESRTCRLSKFGQGFKWKFFSPAAWMAGERRADEQTSSASCASTGNEHTQKRPGGLAGPFHLLPPGLLMPEDVSLSHRSLPGEHTRPPGRSPCRP